MSSSYRPKILKFADYHDEILRTVMPNVTFPLSQEDLERISDMKFSIGSKQLKIADAIWDSAAGMAANQWGINKRIFLFCETPTPEVIINPSYEPLPDPKTKKIEEDLAWEGCFSVPLAVGNVRRYTRIKARWQQQDGTLREKTLTHMPARIWQHETDHLNGLLYDDPKAKKCEEKREFSTREETHQFYED